MWATWAIIAIGGLYFWYESWEDEQRRTRPERIRRRMRDDEHRFVIAIGGEDMLRRMLLEDLRQIAAQRRAIEYAREHFDMDIEWPMKPTEIPTMFSSLRKMGSFISVRRRGV